MIDSLDMKKLLGSSKTAAAAVNTPAGASVSVQVNALSHCPGLEGHSHRTVFTEIKPKSHTREVTLSCEEKCSKHTFIL